MGELLECSHGADVSLKIPQMLHSSSLTPRTQCFNSYENHVLIICRNGQLWWASNKEGKTSSQKKYRSWVWPLLSLKLLSSFERRGKSNCWDWLPARSWQNFRWANFLCENTCIAKVSPWINCWGSNSQLPLAQKCMYTWFLFLTVTLLWIEFQNMFTRKFLHIFWKIELKEKEDLKIMIAS